MKSKINWQQHAEMVVETMLVIKAEGDPLGSTKQKTMLDWLSDSDLVKECLVALSSGTKTVDALGDVVYSCCTAFEHANSLERDERTILMYFLVIMSKNS